MRASVTGKPRPKNLDLTRIRLPLPGFVSILHRISGVLLFLSIPFFLVVFQRSLGSAEGFAAVRECLAAPLTRLLLLGVLWAFLHHFCAGVRFLVLDLHKGIDLHAARASSKLVLAVSLGATALLGGWLLW